MSLNFKNKAFMVLSVGVISLMSACGNNSGGEFYDPAENLNRKTHQFNKAMDRALLRPAGNTYGQLFNDVDDEIINNLADNVSTPSYIANQILQFKFGQAFLSTLRFAVNTTLGFGGMADAASDFGIPKTDTDFGETMYTWGVPEGAYIEVPFFGGRTTRGAVGLVVDLAFDPLDTVIPSDARPYKTGLRLVELAGDRHQYGDVIDGVLYENEDSYASQRLYYLQNRRFELSGGEISDADLENPYDE